MTLKSIADCISDILAIYLLIGLMLNIGYLHVLFNEFKKFNINSKLSQIMYLAILTIVWPLFVYYLIKNSNK